MNKKKMVICVVVVLIVCVLIGVVYPYIKKQIRLSKEPYFTQYALTQEEMASMASYFWVKVTPDLQQELDESCWPDFSYYKIEPTEETEKVVVILNYWLFKERLVWDELALEKAESYGFSLEVPITVNWIIEYPREAISLAKMTKLVELLQSDERKLNALYEEIIAEMSNDSAQSVTQETEITTEQ